MKQGLTENHGWTLLDNGNEYKFVNGDGENEKETHSGNISFIGLQLFLFGAKVLNGTRVPNSDKEPNLTQPNLTKGALLIYLTLREHLKLKLCLDLPNAARAP